MAQNKLLADLTVPITGPGIIPTSPVDATAKFEKFAGQILGFVTIVGVLYFIIQIIFTGYSYIASKGDEKEMETSRKRLTESVLGLVIIIIAVGLGSLLAKLAGIPNVLDINSMFTKMGL